MPGNRLDGTGASVSGALEAGALWLVQAGGPGESGPRISLVRQRSATAADQPKRPRHRPLEKSVNQIHANPIPHHHLVKGIMQKRSVEAYVSRAGRD